MGRRCIPDVVWRISGFSDHLKRESVHPVNASVEKAIRSVISCGAGLGNSSNYFISLWFMTYPVWVYPRQAFFVSSRTAIQKQDRGRR